MPGTKKVLLNFDSQEEVGDALIKLGDLHKLRQLLEISLIIVPWKGTHFPKAPVVTYKRECKHEYPLSKFSTQ